jgi:GH24 family phage-related lysozyme (muramidase)
MEGRKNLTSPQEQLEYDAQTKRLYAAAVAQTGSHADDQWKSWAGDVNGKGAEHSMTGYLNSLSDPVAMANNARDYINFRVQQSQVKFGDDPQINAQVEADAKRDLLKAQVQWVAAKDPAGAQRILEKNKDIAGPEYPALSNELRTRVDQQVGRTGGSAIFARANQNATQQFAAGQPPVEGAKTLLRSFEGFKPQAYWDVNHWCVGYGSDTITKADGTIVPVTQGTVVSQADAERDLTRRAADFTQKAQTQIGADAWGKMTPQAQSVMGSVAYNYGTLPASVVQAAQTGDPVQLSNAVMSLGGDNGGINAGRREAEAGIISGKHSYAIKGDAYRMAIENPDFTDEQRAIALRTISELSNAQEVAYNQNARARIDAVNKAVGDYTTQFWNMLHTPNPDWVSFMGKINADPALADAGPAKDGLMERVIKRSGEEQSLAFGPGYMTVKNNILSDPGAPGHIGTMADIYKLPLGQLTAAGEHDLKGIFDDLKKGPDEYGIQKTRASLETYAKSVMAKEQLIPGFGTLSTNKKGEEIFNSQFIPQFNAAYANWVQKGKDPNEFLTKKNVDEMMDRIYPRDKRAADNMIAQGQGNIPQDANAPLPQPPDGVDQKVWTGLLGTPPLMATGKVATPQQYGNAIKLLKDNPTPDMQAKFDKWFGAPKGMAKDILGTLGGKPTEATVTAPAAAATSAPQATAAPAAAPTTSSQKEEENPAIAARAAEVQRRHAYLQEGLSAIAEGRQPTAKIGTDTPYETPQGSKLDLEPGEMAAAQLGTTLPPMSVHEQSYWDNRERAAMQEQADNLDKREKAIEHLPRDSDSYKLQIATIARQRAFIEQQKQDFEDSIKGRQEAKK